MPELPPRDREHEQGAARSARAEPRSEAVAKGEVLAERLLISGYADVSTARGVLQILRDARIHGEVQRQPREKLRSGTTTYRTFILDSSDDQPKLHTRHIPTTGYLQQQYMQTAGYLRPDIVFSGTDVNMSERCLLFRHRVRALSSA